MTFTAADIIKEIKNMDDLLKTRSDMGALGGLGLSMVHGLSKHLNAVHLMDSSWAKHIYDTIHASSLDPELKQLLQNAVDQRLTNEPVLAKTNSGITAVKFQPQKLTFILNCLTDKDWAQSKATSMLGGGLIEFPNE